MNFQLINSLSKLKRYCEAQDFKGWDPYDGLNSKFFQGLPFLKRSAIARLIVIQGFKRFPFNLRKIFMVPKEYNAKGIGLFLSGYCNLYKAVENDPVLERKFGSLEELKNKIDHLANLLLSLQSKGNYHGVCWGYNFDWQARRLFLFPKFTPTVVATYFCSSALLQAFEITRNNKYLQIAISSADFVINDLHRSEVPGGFLFSYSPLPGNDTVYNASILGAAILSNSYKYKPLPEYKELAYETLKACCEAQAKDGSWVYGRLPVQNWVDSFHTGYNLQGLKSYQENTGDHYFSENIKKGFDYYISCFFLQDGTPKYYNNQIFPIDIHCPGELFVVLEILNKYEEYQELAKKVLNWTIKNMQNKKGYFYYQLKKGISSKISYMRWSNAFMFNALSCMLISTIKN